MTGWFLPAPRLTAATVLQLIFALNCPPHTWGEEKVNPSARHEHLAAAITEELKSISPSRANHQAYVHWLHLDRDDTVDALVIVKPNDSSCAVIKGCLGLVMRGDKETFHLESVFAPNQHPIFLGPRKPDGSLRNFYLSQDGKDFVEFSHRIDHYKITQKGLSYKKAQTLAPWAIGETQFDALSRQTALVRESDLQPAGAPMVLQIGVPPTSIHGQRKTLSYGTTKALEGQIRSFLSQIASRILLSHTVVIELVACEDWIARIPLSDRGDRPLNLVVACQEILGLLHEKFPDTLLNDDGDHYQLIPKNKLDNWRALTAEQRSSAEQSAQAELVEKYMKPAGLVPAPSISRENKLEALIFILAGSIGQPLALQQNIPEQLLAQMNTNNIEHDKYTSRAITYVMNAPQFLYYLIGYRSLIQGSHHFFSYLAADEFFTRATLLIRYKKSLLQTNKEQDLFMADIPARLWAFHCALRDRKNHESTGSEITSNRKTHTDQSDPDWKVCDQIQNLLARISGS
ncbi:MAG TPA: hypothetical protein PK224_19085 [Nitrospira sp.]|nr:hypothetical protein [Nitrospira sp.]